MGRQFCTLPCTVRVPFIALCFRIMGKLQFMLRLFMLRLQLLVRGGAGARTVLGCLPSISLRGIITNAMQLYPIMRTCMRVPQTKWFVQCCKTTNPNVSHQMSVLFCFVTMNSKLRYVTFRASQV